jgi:hypothetical protein
MGPYLILGLAIAAIGAIIGIPALHELVLQLERARRRIFRRNDLGYPEFRDDQQSTHVSLPHVLCMSC